MVCLGDALGDWRGTRTEAVLQGMQAANPKIH